MNNNDNRNREKDDEIGAKIIRVGAILIAAAVIIGCYAYTKVEETMGRIGLFILAGFLLIVGGFIIFVVAVGSRLEKQKCNFFLYDRKTKQDMPLSELTVEEIRRRLIELMSAFRYRGKLYIGDLFDERYTSIPQAIKPLFCYELLLQICEKESEATLFLSYGDECAEIFDKFLTQSGDLELALNIKDFIGTFSAENDNSQEFIDFLTEKRQYIEEKMLDYTKNNFEKFG